MKKLPLEYYQNKTDCKIVREEGRYLIIKDKYGEVKIYKPHLLNGHISTIRTALNKTEYCINQFKEIHGDKYDYSLVSYKNDSTKVKIICKEHGVFEQTPNSHKSGSGCIKCGASRENSFYSVEKALKNKLVWSNVKSGIYIIELNNNEERFTKIGITNDIKERIRHIQKQSDYSIKVLMYENMSLYEAILLESEYLKNKCNIKYKPLQKFSGHTECILTPDNLEYLGKNLVLSDNFLKRISVNEF